MGDKNEAEHLPQVLKAKPIYFWISSSLVTHHNICAIGAEGPFGNQCA